MMKEDLEFPQRCWVSGFVNECGNRIQIVVGRDSDDSPVRIIVRGPKSENENIVTPTEAIKLRDAISEWLKFDVCCSGNRGQTTEVEVEQRTARRCAEIVADTDVIDCGNPWDRQHDAPATLRSATDAIKKEFGV